MMMIRAARASDLASMYLVYYLTEVGEAEGEATTSPQTVPAVLRMVRIDVPGPHPCLAALLERGFQIVYVETFHSTATTPFSDARCYIPSGSDLL